MRLISIKLCNFRQFYGKTPDITVASGDRNTTVIHGNNGAGKTTLLNAFTWVLYEKFTAAFASPHLLINKRAITEAETGASVECWVEIQFEHESKRYQVKRKCYAHRDRDDRIQYSQSKLFMLVVGDDGRWYPPMQQPEEIIERILPESLHQYFFFDGERIDHIFRYGQNRIAEDTKELLGVKVLDRAIDHLKKAVRSLSEELREIGDLETKKLLRQQLDLEKESDRLTVRQQEIAQNIAQQEALKQIVSQQLLQLSGAEKLQQLKEKLESQEQTVRQNLLTAKNNVKQAMSRRGHLIFLAEAISQFTTLMGDLRQQGELPGGIKQQFVQQLLERGVCICGQSLHAETEPYQQVQAWMNRAGIADVEEAAIRLETQVGEIENLTVQFWQDLDREQANIHQYRTELARIENEIDELKEKLRNYPNEDIKKLQNELDILDSTIKELTLEQGINQQQQADLAKDIETVAKQVAKQQLKEEKQTLAQRRIAATTVAIERLVEVRSRLERQFRVSLEQRVQEIFSAISFTPYIPRLSNSYELTLVENTSGMAVPVAASTGENQILSLSFIGGIIDRVREWSHRNTLMGPDSSTFPVVMDSPFGSLDEIYRRQVAQSIPQIANQLVILATKTQWRGEVAAEIADLIGQEYVLVYNSPKPDCEEDSIELDGVSYPLVKRSPNQFEYTEIIPIDH
ncbi:MAG: AAA family ATPase [Cyanophyceae cyanobacterium]